MRVAALILCCATPLCAQPSDIVTYETDQSVDDVLFGLESAIIEAGLVVDSIHEVADMLDRTREDVGSDVVIYSAGTVYSFCSAKVSRQVMEADPMNIAYCPYNIFVTATADDPETTVIGFRGFSEPSMQPAQALLESIAQSAIGE